MCRIRGVGIALMVALCSSWAQGDSRPLTIHIYNLANVPSRRLDSATRDAGRILATAGIEAVWERRPEEREAHVLDLTACKRPAYDGRGYIVVAIVGSVPARYHSGALGYALPNAQAGVNATIFYERIKQIGEEGGTDLATVLGDVMAHEIGHVLLGTTEHSRGGIMKGTWSRVDFQMSHRAAAEFSAVESAAIQKRISLEAANRAIRDSQISKGSAPSPGP